jgi:hypothetical protein
MNKLVGLGLVVAMLGFITKSNEKAKDKLESKNV